MPTNQFSSVFQCHATDPTIRTTVIFSGGEVRYSCSNEDHCLQLLMLSGNPNNAFYNMTMKILKVTRFQAPPPPGDRPIFQKEKCRGACVIFEVKYDKKIFPSFYFEVMAFYMNLLTQCMLYNRVLYSISGEYSIFDT